MIKLNSEQAKKIFGGKFCGVFTPCNNDNKESHNGK